MEMDIRNLDLNELPPLELELMSVLERGKSIAYSAGYSLELYLNAIGTLDFSFLKDIEGIALIRVGSGARLDGAGIGEHEFIVLTKNKFAHANIINQISTFFIAKDWGVTVNTNVDVEVYSIDDSVSLLYHPSNGKPFPGRILEAIFIEGDRSLFNKAKLIVLDQINSKVIRKMKEELRIYRNVSLSGLVKFKGREIVQFDKLKREIYYNPTENAYGLKQGYLRFFQQSLLIDFMILISKGLIDKEDLLDVPESMEEKLRFIIRKGWLNSKYEDYLLKLGFTYSKLVDMQSFVKVHYYKPDNKYRDTASLRLKKGSFVALDDMVEKFPNGSFLNVSKDN